MDPDDTADAAGFTLLRSNNNQDVVAGGFNVHASQETVAGTPYFIRGFGQTAGSLARHVPVTLSNPHNHR